MYLRWVRLKTITNNFCSQNILLWAPISRTTHVFHTFRQPRPICVIHVFDSQWNFHSLSFFIVEIAQMPCDTDFSTQKCEKKSGKKLCFSDRPTPSHCNERDCGWKFNARAKVKAATVSLVFDVIIWFTDNNKNKKSLFDSEAFVLWNVILSVLALVSVE